MLAGGDVLDPAGGLRGLMDIGVAGGKISVASPSLPAAGARAHRARIAEQVVGTRSVPVLPSQPGLLPLRW